MISSYDSYSNLIHSSSGSPNPPLITVLENLVFYENSDEDRSSDESPNSKPLGVVLHRHRLLLSARDRVTPDIG